MRTRQKIMNSKRKLLSLMNMVVRRYKLRSNFIVSSYLGHLEKSILAIPEKDAAEIVMEIRKIVDRN
ncbi:MAG: hypothetical protein KGI06_04090 [Candidatus Micrarchaeota archaeon]|nr:hypothetical protein [Candidatus Micrarchaeota archaeon]